MLKLRKVAVTGGLSCGKSSVCRFLDELGAKVVDADAIVHKLLTPETSAGRETIKLLGSEIVVGNQIDRAKIARRVFTHPTLLRSLENILHPYVYEEIELEYKKTKEKGKHTLFIADIPLLFESGGDRFFDTTVAVISGKEACWDRFRKSTGYEREEFDRRMAEQILPEEKVSKADHVIRNDGTLEELKEKVIQLYKQLNH